MDWITDPQSLIALLTLTVLEIVLGIDNIIFISILSGKLPHDQQNKARIIGLALAMLTRVALLFSLSLIMRLTSPLFNVFGAEISGRDIILISGGLFLLAKATHEIHDKLEGEEGKASSKSFPSFTSVITQIVLLDIVFSLDSVITAIGMSNVLMIMILAVVIAVGFMMFFSKSISDFVQKHPTVKMLALSFLLLIGVSLIAEGLDQHIPKGYIYFSLGFPRMLELSERSSSHLSRTFRNYLGDTPTNFLNNIRLNYAANLISNSDEDITLIAYDAGFDSLSHFFHLFRKQFKLTPKHFRQKHQKSLIPF